MAEPPSPDAPMPTPRASLAEREATANRAAFLHWLHTVHGIPIEPGDAALRAWAEAGPATSAALVRQFSGAGFASARLAVGLLLQADLRPDDRLLVLGADPDWLSQARAATNGLAPTPTEATVLITDHPPETLPPKLRRAILLGGAAADLPPEITVSRPEDWTYPSEAGPSESSAD